MYFLQILSLLNVVQVHHLNFEKAISKGMKL